MVSSLAAQLAQGTSLNASLLAEKSRKKTVESYLFTGREATQHDLESIYALGLNGFNQLKKISHRFDGYEEPFFSVSAKSTDRTLLTAETVKTLDSHLRGFLRRLGPYLMDAPTGKVLEWLVRRFRIHEFNVEEILVLFLPYHESPHFTKMLKILHILPNSIWNFLIPYQTAVQSIPRISIVSEMSNAADFVRFVTSLLPTYLKVGCVHRTLLAFNAATLHDFILSQKSLNEETAALLLPNLLRPLQHTGDRLPDAILGSYVLLAAFSQKCHLSPEALEVIIGAMAACANHVSTQQFVNAAVAVCEAQDELQSFQDSTLDNILRLKDIQNELSNAFGWQGFEKLVHPLLTHLILLSDSRSISVLEFLLTFQKTPSIVSRRCAVGLLRYIVSAEGTETDVSSHRRILSIIQQRYPSALQKAMEDSDEGDLSRDSVEQIVMSLSVVFPNNGSGEADKIVASTNANKSVRAVAVRDLIRSLSEGSDLDPAYVSSAHSAILTRVADPSKKVISALYANPSAVLPIFSKQPEQYLTSVANVLSTQKCSLFLIRAHLTFLACHFCPANQSFTTQTFQSAFFPFLMHSRQRLATAEMVWDIVGSVEAEGAGMGGFQLLGGCVEAWKWEVDKVKVTKQGKADNEAFTVAKMKVGNLALATKIAENVLVSNDYASHLEFLLSRLRDRRAHSRVFALLIVRSLINQLSGEHQVSAAHKIFLAMGIETLNGMSNFMGDNENLQEYIQDDKLAENLVRNPTTSATTHWLQASILALLPAISRPMNGVLDWFAEPYSDTLRRNSTSETRGTQYIWLMRAIYKLANSSTSLPLLSTRLLQVLFMTLGTETLAFLAGTWTSCSSVDSIAALRHAAAFITAHAAPHPFVDFQAILPALLVALQGSDSEARDAAAQCVVLLSQHSTRKAPQSIYCFDELYGEGSKELQYLEWQEFTKYIDTLAEHRSYFGHDPDYVQAFHREYFSSGPLRKDQLKQDRWKKDLSYKQHVLCYLLSHVNAIRLPSAKIAILKAVRDISDECKVQTMLPTIQKLVTVTGWNELKALFDSSLEQFAILVFSFFDKSLTKELNESDSLVWPVYIQALQYCIGSSSSSSMQEVVTRPLEGGLFVDLNYQRKMELSKVLINLAISDGEAYASCKSLLAIILGDVQVITQLLILHRPSSKDVDLHARKRAKIDADPLQNSVTDPLASLTLISEVLASGSLPGSLTLISQLLEALDAVVHYESPVSADLNYVEQLLMSAVESAGNKVIEVSNLSPSTIRLDILVELIRVSENPQTFHQALLLMANLARLAPDSALHNVMPVFTFMGSNVFHRDDSYSFRVVQKTIDSIVPVMVSSLKRVHSDSLSLYIGSRDFLRVFTDASNHIPRHRRTHFFAHVVDVLGPDEFLAPVCMLLVDKVAARIVRHGADEVATALALPVSVLQHYQPLKQINLLEELLRESQRLITRIIAPDSHEPLFLDMSTDEDNTPPQSHLKRRAQALIIFVGHAMKNSQPTFNDREARSSGNTGQLVSLLVDISATMGAATGNTLGDISKVARTSIHQILGAMGAEDFVIAVATMLQSKDSRVQIGALELLHDRLESIAEKVRKEATPSINEIIHSIRGAMKSSEPSFSVAAFKALKAICITMCSGEENSLSSTIPLALTCIRSREAATAPALSFLSPLVSKLGPRVIPSLRDLVSECTTLANECLESNRENLITVNDALDVLHSLLVVIPTFWGSTELTRTIKLYVENVGVASQAQTLALTNLMKTFTKRVPAKTILPPVLDVWASVHTRQKQKQVLAYFRLLKRALHAAPRQVILEHVRALFNIFLEAFDLNKQPNSEADEAQTEAISAFMELVVKLNETAFRPLFRRLHDWAFIDQEATTARKTMLCHLYSALLDYFKSLMTPYMSFLLQPFSDILQSFTKSTHDTKELWICIIRTLTSCLSIDEGAFWREDKLRQVSTLVIEQLPVCIRLNMGEDKVMLSNCLISLVGIVSDDALLKNINLNLLMHTRSEDVRVRLFALSCSEILWREHGGKLLGFAAETITFVAECAEDENDSVVKESHKLKNAVENVAGNIIGYEM